MADRAYRLHYNNSQKRTDRFAAVSPDPLGLASPTGSAYDTNPHLASTAFFAQQTHVAHPVITCVQETGRLHAG
jgi:hypothetical protein